ncbi:DUF2560 family protein [Serratia sp. TSA_7]|jgi:hypothetical protein|uniref:DUF2560 family protein n=1 Tax=Serratia sp. TSA_7 TaxID=3415659 RepID=UPI004046C1DC
METDELTASQKLRMDLLMLLSYDTAATKQAIAFVKDDRLNYEMFVQQFNRVTTEDGVVGRTTKAIQESVEALAIFSNTAV